MEPVAFAMICQAKKRASKMVLQHFLKSTDAKKPFVKMKLLYNVFFSTGTKGWAAFNENQLQVDRSGL